MKLKLFFLFFLLLTKNIFAITAPAIVLNPEQKTYDLRPYIEMYADEDKQANSQNIAQENFTGQFVPYNKILLAQAKDSEINVWLRFKVINPTQRSIQLFLTTDFSNYYNGWNLYLAKNDGTLVKQKFSRYFYTLFPIEVPAKSVQVFYLNNAYPGTLLSTFLLKKPLIHLIETIDQYFLIGISYGIMLALILHSIFMLTVLRDRNYLIYILLVTVCLLGALIKDGFLNRFPFLVLSSWLFLHLFYLCLIVGSILYVLLTIYVLQSEQSFSDFKRIIKVYFLMAIAVAIFQFFPSHSIYQIVYAKMISAFLYLLTSFLLVFLLTMKAVRRRYMPAYYYLFSIVLALIGFIAYALTNQKIIEVHRLVLLVPGYFVDINLLLQGIAIAARYNLIQESEIKAQQEIIKQKDLNTKLQTKALQQQRQLVTAYARFFPQKFLELMNKSSILEIHLGDQVKKRMTILVSDLRNFTSILETKSPAESFAFINECLKNMSPLIRNHRGFIDKYIGDAILAIFESAGIDAAYAAIEIIQALKELKLHKFETDQKIDIGVGIHFGTLILGTIGEQQRMDEAVIGKTSNIAAQLESLNKVYGTHILISDEVYDDIKSHTEFKIRFIDYIFINQVQASIKIYEIFNPDSDEIIAVKIKLMPLYEEALDLYTKGNFESALEIFSQCQQILPTDKVLQLYIDRCKKYMHETAVKNWVGRVNLVYKTEVE